MNLDPKSKQPSAQAVRFDQSADSRAAEPKTGGNVLIDLKGVSKNFGNWQALKGVDLTVSDAVTGLLGPNGAGKSTLIKILLGLVSPSEGSGTFFGIDIVKNPIAIRQQVGFMPEDDCFIDGLTGIQSVEMSAKFFGMPAPESLRRSHEVLDFCGFKQERYREVSGYSTGMRQLIKFASAIVHNPKFLILDEPTTGLDPEERERLLRRVKWLNEEFGIGAMLSTHILPDVQAICDDVVIMADGQVRSQKSLSELQKTDHWSLEIAGQADSGQKIQQLTQFFQSFGWTVDVGSNTELHLQVGQDADAGEVSKKIWDCCLQIDAVLLKAAPAEIALDEIFLQTVKGNS